MDDLLQTTFPPKQVIVPAFAGTACRTSRTHSFISNTFHFTHAATQSDGTPGQCKKGEQRQPDRCIQKPGVKPRHTAGWGPGLVVLQVFPNHSADAHSQTKTRETL